MIHLYKNINPNTEGNTHYLYNTQEAYQNYINELGTPFLSIPQDRYQINSGTIMIEMYAGFVFNNVTYIRVDNEVSEYDTFYHVIDMYEQSGFIVFNVAKDIWGTFIPFAKISDIECLRCNRNIGKGIYDDIALTELVEIERLTEEGLLEYEKMSIVYVVVYASGTSSIFSNGASSNIGVYASSFTTFEDPNIPPSTPFRNVIQYGITCISSIYQDAISGGEARVLKAYLIPSQFLEGIHEENTRFKCVAPDGEKTLIPTIKCYPIRRNYTIDFETDPNYNYYVGTPYDGLKIVRTTQGAHIIYSFIVKQNGCQIIVKQGENEYDLTSSFEISLSTTDGNLTTLEKIKEGISLIGNTASAGFQIAQGGAGYITGTLTAINGLSNTIITGNPSHVGAGDGLNACTADGRFAYSPFAAVKCKSVYDEQAKARINGAIFSQYIENIHDIFDYPFIGSSVNTKTVLQCNARISNVPNEAVEVIGMKLRNGIIIESV